MNIAVIDLMKKYYLLHGHSTFHWRQFDHDFAALSGGNPHSPVFTITVEELCWQMNC